MSTGRRRNSPRTEGTPGRREPRPRPLDPRLLRATGSARRWVVLLGLFQVLNGALLVVQAWFLARALASCVVAATNGTTLPLGHVGNDAAVVAAVFAVRGLLAAAQERFGHRAALGTIADLRAAVLRRLADAGPAALDGDRGTRLTVLSTRGLDALDAYLTKYLPQLLATAVVTPALLVVTFFWDTISGLVLLVTIPLVPVLMALVGWTTADLAARRTAQLQRLGAQVLDLVTGIPTLRALGRDVQQATRVRSVGDAYRKATNRVLRQAFLSGMVLELFTTLAVAIVAVAIGLRLVHGGLDLHTGLAVLILAPEVFLPLRMVGLHYHASADGSAAAMAALDFLDEPSPASRDHEADPGRRLEPTSAVTALSLEGVRMERPGRAVAAPADLHATAGAGQVLALIGDNGAGKSTAVEVALGLRAPTRGTVRITTADGVHPLTEVSPDWWHRQCAWVPQNATIVPGTLRDNVTLGQTQVSPALDAVSRSAGLTGMLAEHPLGWDRPLGRSGSGVSAGQRQRIALARALLRVHSGSRVLVLDEPTAHLDPDTQSLVLRAVEEARDLGCLVLLVAHRPELIAVADQVVSVHAEGLDHASQRHEHDEEVVSR